MRLIVTNPNASCAEIINLGKIPARESAVFPISSYSVQGGVGGERAEIFNQLTKLGCTYELALDSHDKGLVAHKQIAVTTADLVAKGAHASADFSNAYAFCDGATLLSGTIDVTQLVNNSDAGFAAGTCLVDIGFVSAHDALKANLDVEHGSGSVARSSVTALAGTDLSSKFLYLDIANSAGTALMNETTAGAFTLDVFYTVV